VQSVLLVAKYWSQSVVPLPVLDLSADKSAAALSRVLSLSSTISYISHFWSYGGIILVGITVLSLLIADLYLQLFQSYSSACVAHSSRDTYFSALLVPTAYDYAASAGNALLIGAVELYNLNASSICAERQAIFTDSFDSDTRDILLSSRDYSSNSDRFTLFSSCINATAMDRLYHNTSSAQRPNATEGGIVSNPLKTPSFYLNSTACVSTSNNTPNSLLPQLTRTGFNCSNLPLCAVGCTGPDVSVISDLSRQCSCMGEWFVHSRVLSIGVAACMYVTLYVSCHLLHTGLLMTEWRHLRPAVFDVKASCDTDGEIQKQEGESEHQNEVADARRTQLGRQLRAYEQRGYLVALAGGAVNMLWIALLIIARNNIAYIPHGGT
jgi:hypothetical protein